MIVCTCRWPIVQFSAAGTVCTKCGCTWRRDLGSAPAARVDPGTTGGTPAWECPRCRLFFTLGQKREHACPSDGYSVSEGQR